MAESYDARAAACVSTAWVILINKPIYLFYVWALIGADAATRSLATLALTPLYAALPVLARRSPRGARIALPLVGLADTIYATKLMGAETGPELFLFACGLLAVVSFSAREAMISRSLVIVVYLASLGLHGRYGSPLQTWPAEQAGSLFALNLYGAASLAAYIGLRFATAT